MTPWGGRLSCEDPGSPLTVAALPPAWRAAAAWHLAPAADELAGGWAAIPPGRVVALAWQGVLRAAGPGAPARSGPPRSRAVARRADIVGMATEELDPADNLHERLRQLRTGAICILARGSGSRGGIAIAVRPGSPRMRRWPASARAAAPVADEGVFLAAVLAARVAPALAGRQPHLPGALAFATGVAAARRDPGLAGVPTLAAVRDALRAGAAAGDQRARNEPPGATPDRYDDGAATRRDDRP